MPTAKKPTVKTAKPTAKSRTKKKATAAAKSPKATAKPAKKRTASKRELVEPHKGDKRFVRRKGDGTFGKTSDVGKSLSADRRSKAKTKVPKGQGDRGDTRR